MRILSTFIFSTLLIAVPVSAQSDDLGFQLPSDAEIEQIIADMPDLNAIMDGFLAVAQDEDLRTSLEDTGEKLSARLEALSDIEIRDNGTPDLNLLMATMMYTLSDDDVMGDLLNVVTELQDVIDDNFDEEMLGKLAD